MNYIVHKRPFFRKTQVRNTSRARTKHLSSVDIAITMTDRVVEGPSSPPPAKKARVRSKGWTGPEEETLIDEVLARESTLFGDLKGVGIKSITRIRAETWECIATAISTQFCVARRDPSEVKKKFFNLKQRVEVLNGLGVAIDTDAIDTDAIETDVDDPADPSSEHETADTDSNVEGVHRKADTCTKRKSQHMSKQQEATFINTVKDTQRIDLEIKTLKAQLDTMKEATAAFKSLKEMANTVNTYYQSKQVKLNTLDMQNIQFEYINNSEL